MLGTEGVDAFEFRRGGCFGQLLGERFVEDDFGLNFLDLVFVSDVASVI